MPLSTSEQMDGLESYAKDFVAWLETEDGKDNIKEHREHERFFKDRLSPQKLEKLTEEGFSDIYKTLWVSRMWTNKDWYIRNKLLAPNGIEKIRTELKNLLYGDGDIASRYDGLTSRLHGFGVSSISEILHTVFPEKYCLWNDKPKTVIPFLGLDILPGKFFKYQITEGSEYAQCVEELAKMKEELKEYGVKDFIDLDMFFWHIFEDIIPNVKTERVVEKKETPVTSGKPEIDISSHEGAEYYLLELGKMLGYSSYTVDQSVEFEGKRLGDVALLKQIPTFASERDMKTVKEIDVIWFNEDENPEYAFEVEHTTDIVHGLDRLIQLQHLYVKLVIVASEDRRSKYDSLLQRVQYRKIHNRFRFISYDELANFYVAARPFHELKTKLLGED